MSRKGPREYSYPQAGKFCVFDLGPSTVNTHRHLLRVPTCRLQRPCMLGLIISVRNAGPNIDDNEVTILAEDGSLFKNWTWYSLSDECIEIDDLGSILLGIVIGG